MEPIPKLNRAHFRRMVGPLLLALFVAASVGLLHRQLAAIYSRPIAVSALSANLPSRREDARLFEQALAAGLLRPEADGRIAVAPADLPLRQTVARAYLALLVPRADGPDWLGGPWNDDILRIHRALHFSAAGRYVRQQVGAFNANQLLAAIRWRSDSGLTGDWRADWAGAPLTLTATVPSSVGQLFADIPGDWQAWRRVARWPALEGRSPVRFRLARSGHRPELLVVGGTPNVVGATVLASESRCLERSACTGSAAIAHWLRLEWQEGAFELEVSFLPLPARVVTDFTHSEGVPIRREGGRLLWRDGPEENGAGSSHRSGVAPRHSRAGKILERDWPVDSLGANAIAGREDQGLSCNWEVAP
jgi:hypothetical protein